MITAIYHLVVTYPLILWGIGWALTGRKIIGFIVTVMEEDKLLDQCMLSAFGLIIGAMVWPVMIAGWWLYRLECATSIFSRTRDRLAARKLIRFIFVSPPKLPKEDQS